MDRIMFRGIMPALITPVNEDGTIREVGSHDELMAKNGMYADLYRSQFVEVA